MRFAAAAPHGAQRGLQPSWEKERPLTIDRVTCQELLVGLSGALRKGAELVKRDALIVII